MPGAEILEFFKQNYEFDDQSLGEDVLKKDRRKVVKKISKAFIEHEGIIIENEKRKIFLNQKYRVNVTLHFYFIFHLHKMTLLYFHHFVERK